MNIRLGMHAKEQSQYPTEGRWGPNVCWTRMQSEAGQRLEDIVARKEIERQAGDGVFFWGVGNAPSSATAGLARLEMPVDVVFSVMKGRPRAVDRSPQTVMVWRSYLDMFGIERELPPQALVTSRGETAGGTKRRHYALICRSWDALCIGEGEGFDPAAYRNVGSNGGPVGASQVTALLRRVGPEASCDYEVNFRAKLHGSYWVKLTNPVAADASAAGRIADAVKQGSVERWLDLVAELREGEDRMSSDAAEPRFI